MKISLMNGGEVSLFWTPMPDTCDAEAAAASSAERHKASGNNFSNDLCICVSSQYLRHGLDLSVTSNMETAFGKKVSEQCCLCILALTLYTQSRV